MLLIFVRVLFGSGRIVIRNLPMEAARSVCRDRFMNFKQLVSQIYTQGSILIFFLSHGVSRASKRPDGLLARFQCLGRPDKSAELKKGY